MVTEKGVCQNDAPSFCINKPFACENQGLFAKTETFQPVFFDEKHCFLLIMSEKQCFLP